MYYVISRRYPPESGPSWPEGEPLVGLSDFFGSLEPVTLRETSNRLLANGYRWNFPYQFAAVPLTEVRPATLFMVVYGEEFHEGFEVLVLMDEIPDTYLFPLIFKSILAIEDAELERGWSDPDEGSISSWLGYS